jgi:hypothetical protein
MGEFLQHALKGLGRTNPCHRRANPCHRRKPVKNQLVGPAPHPPQNASYDSPRDRVRGATGQTKIFKVVDTTIMDPYRLL